MNKPIKIKFYLMLCLIALILILPTGTVVGQEGPFGGIKEKMASISETEQENLRNLFVMKQQIQEMEKEEDRFTRDLILKNAEIENLKGTIAEAEIAHANQLEDLRQVLKSYQRMGPGSYLEIILKSDNLAMLLRRVNTLRDLTRNTGKLMDSLDETKATLLSKKTNLTEKISLLEENQRQFQESLTKKKQLITDQENYLTSLKDEREDYQENLAKLQQNWDELKTSVPGIILELAEIINEGKIPADKVKISIKLKSITGAVDEETLNEMISGHPLLSKIRFSLYPNQVAISMPDKNLVLSGQFVILEAHIIKFQVKEGTFFGIPLDPGAIEDLFLKGDLKFNLKLPLNDYTLNSIKTTEGTLEWTITP